MTPLDWVRHRGIVLESAHGPIPSLAEQVAGEPIHGSWWGHRAGHEIYAAIESARECPDVVALRLVNGKVTLVHRRLWPALVRVADAFPPERLAAIRDEHTPSGAHRATATPFPAWVPKDVLAEANGLDLQAAWEQLPLCLRPDPNGKP
ncbi:MAG TPA: hypothetical protein VEJ84_17480 [Acidimicrobiales bacterium]|nr:hypothetical protein [Acidimicrobiales bacterium]